MCYLSNTLVSFPGLPTIMLCNLTEQDDRLLGLVPVSDL